VCDWNNDDSLDLITGERNGYFTFFRRRGDGTLTNAGRVKSRGVDIQTNNNAWPWVCDWNNDGRKDLLVGQEGIGAPSNVYVYLNQGSDAEPVFNESTPVLRNGSGFTEYRTVPVTRDLDQDGRKDLVLGEWYSSVRYYRNTGTDSSPVFTSYTNLVPPDPSGFVNGNPPRFNLVDWDGDTDLDMVSCDYYGSVFIRIDTTTVGIAAPPPGAPSGRLTVTPNPARGPVRVELGSNLPVPATVAIYDAAGQLVRTIAGDPATWDLRDDAGRLIPAGTYWCRVATTGGSAVARVVVAR
jgi:hypothetical protein